MACCGDAGLQVPAKVQRLATGTGFRALQISRCFSVLLLQSRCGCCTTRFKQKSVHVFSFSSPEKCLFNSKKFLSRILQIWKATAYMVPFLPGCATATDVSGISRRWCFCLKSLTFRCTHQQLVLLVACYWWSGLSSQLFVI